MKKKTAVLLTLLAVVPMIGAEIPPFDQPVLITSAGQSAEVQIVSVLAKRAGIEAVLDKLATAESLKNRKPATIMLVLGVSMKGMGAAGLDLKEEKTRIAALLLEAERQTIPILCLHLGGEARRGDMSDAMIKEYIPYAAAAMVVQSGNSDSLFSTLCDEQTIPLIEVDRAANALAPLKKLFNIE